MVTESILHMLLDLKTLVTSVRRVYNICLLTLSYVYTNNKLIQMKYVMVICKCLDGFSRNLGSLGGLHLLKGYLGNRKLHWSVMGVILEKL